jgi:Transcription factor TFIID complex subunit 8 C-term
VKDPTKESDTRWSQPFPHDVPDFPEAQRRRQDEKVVVHDTRVKAPQAPGFLPPYPPLHTYKRTIAGSKKRMLQSATEEDESAQRLKRLASVKSVEESLVKIETAADAAPVRPIVSAPKSSRAP